MKNAYQEKKRLWLLEFRRQQKCLKCGFDDYRALVFHHRNGSQKEFSIGEALRMGRSLESMKKEIEKCDVLCANCHSIHHFDSYNT